MVLNSDWNWHQTVTPQSREIHCGTVNIHIFLKVSKIIPKLHDGDGLLILVLPSLWLKIFMSHKILEWMQCIVESDKGSFKSIWNFLVFLSFSVIWNWNDRYVLTHSHSSLENHTLFQTKIGKVYTRFRPKAAPKTLHFGAAYTCLAYIREQPPPPPRRLLCSYQS